ncbi:ABC transporter substrate-binding protein [Ruania alba]|uniref:Carbohydrate ABC transporter substrate-binding protein, CUT1 family n=1 Tax=Ruania alba TaxID=648782 RepID=A0A1H5KMW4_9MICO|nr:extracellular solute-binding protein [Ruania alba]SEE65421.1 carbohydrate ABC transporter substrate-binding protein, CUT1 family [Ruania alba]
MRDGRLTGTAAAALASCLALAACSGGGDGGTDGGDAADGPVTFWTPHVQPDRMAAQQEVAAQFTDETGIEVEVVAMAGADQNQALITGAASGDVPDVALHAPDLSAWQSQGLINSDAATSVIDSLGADTFNQQSLDFVTINDAYQAIPADGWVHLIAYRSDILDEAGIAPPTSLGELADAARTVREDVGITGMAMGTQAGTASSTEAIESTFQQTGCELVQDGTVAVDSPECAEAAGHFATLADSSAAGPFDVLSARSAYLNGDAAFLLFSTHILDELAGLDADNPLTCDECADDENFLRENTGFITVLDENNPAQYGTTLNYVIPEGANAEGASEFVEYMLSDGYSAMLGTAPRVGSRCAPATPRTRPSTSIPGAPSLWAARTSQWPICTATSW